MSSKKSKSINLSRRKSKSPQGSLCSFSINRSKRSPANSTTHLTAIRPKEVNSMMKNARYRPNYDSVRKLSRQVKQECIESGFNTTNREDLVAISREAKTHFMDYTITKKFQCALMSVLYQTQKEEIDNPEGIPVLDVIVQDYFTPIKAFGKASANGAAYKVGWMDSFMPSSKGDYEVSKDGDKLKIKINKKSEASQIKLSYDWIAVLKIAKGSAQEDADLFHELAVGLALDSLRKEVPYFMYVWGGFYCDRPLSTGLQCGVVNPKKITTLALFELVEGKEIEEWMLSDEAKPESKEPSRKSGEKMTVSECVQVVVQVAYALSLAQRRYKFVHYDLHSGNVLIRRLSEKKELKLVLKNGDVVKMKTRWIPQLIDYGMSSMMIDGKFVTNRFNEHKEETKNVLDLQDEPLKYFLSMYDIWRYVTFFVGSLWDAQYEGFEEVWKRLIIPFYKLSKGVAWSKPTKVSEMFSKIKGGSLGKKLGELLLDNRLSRDLELSDVGWLEVDVEEYLREVLRGG